jgi:hypothetical protein
MMSRGIKLLKPFLMVTGGANSHLNFSFYIWTDPKWPKVRFTRRGKKGEEYIRAPPSIAAT